MGKFWGKTQRSYYYLSYKYDIEERFMNVFNGIWLRGPQYIVDWMLLLAWIIILVAPMLIHYNWDLTYEGNSSGHNATVLKNISMCINEESSQREMDGYSISDFSKIETLRKGERVSIIGYVEGDIKSVDGYKPERRYFQVKSKSGNIGIVHHSAFCSLKNIHTFAKDIPKVHPTGSVVATTAWLNSRVKKQITTRDQVESYYWGVPVAVRKANYKKAKYEEDVFYSVDIRTLDDIRKQVCITYNSNGRVKDVQCATVKTVTGLPIWSGVRMVALGWFDNSDFLTRFTAKPISEESVDLTKAKKKLPWWLNLALWVLAYCIVGSYYAFIAARFAGALVMPIGRIPVISFFLSLCMVASTIYFSGMMFMLWEVPWYGRLGYGLIVLFFAWNWFYWCKWNHCPFCARFYTKNTLDEQYDEEFSSIRRDHYDLDVEIDEEIEEEVTKYDGVEIDRREIGRREVGRKVVGRRYRGTTIEHYKDWRYSWELQCCHCGKKSHPTHSGSDLISREKY